MQRRGGGDKPPARRRLGVNAYRTFVWRDIQYAMCNMTELYLIRHGNAQKQKGRTYVTAPLTELGRKQADVTGEYFKRVDMAFDGFYASPLRRAIETATLIGAHISETPEVRQGIQEMEDRELPGTIALELFARTGALNKYYGNARGR